ncbi:MAG: cupin domain-containing protein [Pseudomonadota bacterium]
MAVLRFNLDDPEGGLSRSLAPGIDTQLFWGRQAMMSVLTCAPNASGEMHHHPEEQWAVVLEGDGVFVIGGEELEIATGDVCCVPPGTPHNFIAGPGGARILDVFAPPRQAYTEAGRGFASAG